MYSTMLPVTDLLLAAGIKRHGTDNTAPQVWLCGHASGRGIASRSCISCRSYGSTWRRTMLPTLREFRAACTPAAPLRRLWVEAAVGVAMPQLCT